MEFFVHDADIQDLDGGRDVLESAMAEYPGREKVWTDS